MDINSIFEFGDAIGVYTIHSGTDILVYTFIRLILGIIGIVLTSILFFTFCINRAFHPNLKIISVGFTFAMMMDSVITIIQSTLVIISIKIMEAYSLNFINSFLLVFAANSWQCILFAFAIERTVATIRNETYEANKKWYFGIILVSASVSLKLFNYIN